MNLEDALTTLELEVSNVTKESISKSYRSKVVHLHPDKNGASQTAQQDAEYKKLNEAKELLMMLLDGGVPLHLAASVEQVSLSVAKAFIEMPDVFHHSPDSELVGKAIQYVRLELQKNKSMATNAIQKGNLDKKRITRLLNGAKAPKIAVDVWMKIAGQIEQHIKGVQQQLDKQILDMEALTYIEINPDVKSQLSGNLYIGCSNRTVYQGGYRINFPEDDESDV